MVPAKLSDIAAGVGVRACFIPPLLAALSFAWVDVRERRIPNFLTLGTAVAGLGFRWGYGGWEGALDGCLGMGVGLGLLLLPYWLGGVGAGDVKALAALGAWLNPLQTLYLFLFMAVAGGGLAVAMLWWQGQLLVKISQSRIWFMNRVLSHPHGHTEAVPAAKTGSLPYGAALALGMVILFLRGV